MNEETTTRTGSFSPRLRLVALALAALVVAISSVLAIKELRQRVERGSETQLVSANIRLDATGLAALALISGTQSSAGSLVNPVETEARESLREGLDRLGTVLPDQTLVERVRDATAEFVQQIDAAAGGMPTDLTQPATSLPYLTWFELDNALTEVDRVALARADSAERAAEIGTWIIVLAAGLLVFLLASKVRTERARSVRFGREAHTDPLTGLANRRAFYEAIASSLGPHNDDRAPVSLLILDLDYFKKVNDTHGHQTGDAVLIEVAERLKSSVRAGDLLARMGGDEFAWILHRCPHEAATMVADRALVALTAEPFDSVGPVSACVGVATSTEHTDTEALVKAADASLYRAKREGRGRIDVDADEVLTSV